MPLAVDTQLRVPVGPVQLPVRAVLMLALSAPPAILVLQCAPLSISLRCSLAAALVLCACTLATPTREGIWFVTWLLYREAWRLLPNAVIDGVPASARVATVGGAARVSGVRSRRLGCAHRVLADLAAVPMSSFDDDGVLTLRPGGCFGVLCLQVPAGHVGNPGHARWCEQLVDWVFATECAVQLLTLSDHHDSVRTAREFDDRVRAWPASPLRSLERDLLSRLAEHSLGLRHFVVLSPGQAGGDGIPVRSRLRGAWRQAAPRREAALAALTTALRLAPAAGITCTIPDRDAVAPLLAHGVLGARTVAAGRSVLQVGDQHHVVVAALRLPSTIEHGVALDALMRSRSRAVVSLHLAPVSADVARTALRKRMAMQRYVMREGNDDVDNQVAIADTTAMLASIAQRETRVCRIALSAALIGDTHEDAMASAARFDSALRTHGFDVATVTAPALLPALGVAPGGAPLHRALQLTTEQVASCVVPMVGTPFADDRQPLVGISEATAAPAHLSLWSRTNHNALVMGSSGAGKSVAVKTLLIRHLMEGATAVVIDPDSEYRRVMRAVGGIHLELGVDALNPLGLPAGTAPDVAAGIVLPVLSVMGGDDRGVRDGRPIRRLPDEDQGWLYGEVAAFFGRRCDDATEPLLHELVDYIRTSSVHDALTDRERDRLRVITARLARFTQGDRAVVFDRASTFRVSDRPVAIGLRHVAMTYAADLTPALAVVLTSVLAFLQTGLHRLIVVVDEAHRVTADPDAGEVLGRLVRQARKYGAGVWMCSQRIEDFVATDLGRTLAATAATKLIMGVEEAALTDVRTVFGLHDEEIAAVHPPVQGRGVLLSGAERSVVRVLPGPAILAMSDTGAATTIAAGAAA